MPKIIRYLTHPQVHIAPDRPVPLWSLNAQGAARVAELALRPGALTQTRRIISSAETKAIETASPMARALGIIAEIRPRLHENDRSSTGFLPPAAFEAMADAFFATPDISIRGWETARAAQARILAEVEACLSEPTEGDILFVGHGAVGTLLYCAWAGHPIDRRFDQPPGGGFWFACDADTRKPAHGWQPMEALQRSL